MSKSHLFLDTFLWSHILLVIDLDYNCRRIKAEEEKKNGGQESGRCYLLLFFYLFICFVYNIHFE